MDLPKKHKLTTYLPADAKVILPLQAGYEDLEAICPWPIPKECPAPYLEPSYAALLEYEETIWLYIATADSLPSYTSQTLYEGMPVYFNSESELPFYFCYFDDLLFYSTYALAVEQTIFHYRHGGDRIEALSQEGPFLRLRTLPDLPLEPGPFVVNSPMSDSTFRNWRVVQNAKDRGSHEKYSTQELLMVLPDQFRSLEIGPAQDHGGMAGLRFLSHYPDEFDAVFFPSRESPAPQKDILETETYLNYDIHHFLTPANYGLAENFWGLSLGEWDLFSDRPELLERIVDAFVSGNVLARHPDILPALESFPPKYSKMTILQKAKDWWIYQKSSDDWELFTIPISTTDRIDLVWSFRMADKALHGPWMLYADQGGLAVQDQSHQLHVLDLNGEEKWGFDASEPIINVIEVKHPDKSNESAVLIQTPQAIILLDHSGDIISPATKLPATCSTSLSVFAFDRALTPSLFFLLDNGQIYASDELGNPIPDWLNGPMVGETTFPIQHIQFENRDYIYLVNDDGELHVFDRAGNYRFPPVEGRGAPIASPAFNDHLQTRDWIWMDAESGLNRVALDGSFQLDEREKLGNPRDILIQRNANKRDVSMYMLSENGLTFRYNFGIPERVDKYWEVPEGSDNIILLPGGIESVWNSKTKIWNSVDPSDYFIPFDQSPIYSPFEFRALTRLYGVQGEKVLCYEVYFH